MNNNDKKIEKASLNHEEHRAEHRHKSELEISRIKDGTRKRHRIEAQHVAEIRRGNDGKLDEGEGLRSADKKLLTRKLTPDEVANQRRRLVLENKKVQGRMQKLEQSNNASDVPGSESQEQLENILDQTDPYWRDADRRTAEGIDVFVRDSNARRLFCSPAGTWEHSRWKNETIEMEQKAGRIKGLDFDTEKVMRHPDGRTIRLDYVDYRKDLIVDRKPIGENERNEDVIKKYEEQRNRHIAAYEYETGRKVLEYRYSLYPSPKDI